MSYCQRSLDQYLVRHQLSGSAADYIRRASAGLARDIGTNGYTCVVTEYQSRKMGVTINTESRTAECLYAIHLDFDPKVEAFFEQPPAIDCHRMTKRGTRRLVNYVPDMLVLSDAGPLVAQVKTEKELLSRIASSEDWVRLADGTTQDLAAERALSQIGLTHVVISTEHLSKLRSANISLLLQSIEYAPEDEDLLEAVKSFYERNTIASLTELAKSVGTRDITPLLRLIATHVIHTDLTRFSLTEPNACFVTTKPSLLRDDVYGARQELRRKESHCSDVEVSSDILPSSKHLARGVEIVDQLDAGLTGRSARRWKSRIIAGAENGQSKVIAVTPRYDKSGNRNAKRPPEVLAFVEKTIRAEWASDIKPSPSALWRIYKTGAEEVHPAHKPVSRTTFLKILKREQLPLAEERGGKRAGNAAAAPSNIEDRSLKATRPFELASTSPRLQ